MRTTAFNPFPVNFGARYMTLMNQDTTQEVTDLAETVPIIEAIRAKGFGVSLAVDHKRLILLSPGERDRVRKERIVGQELEDTYVTDQRPVTIRFRDKTPSGQLASAIEILTDLGKLEIEQVM